ncbi:MAG: hypothetical protein WA941_05610 [Nitrososphaeraceae archaeon]
MPKFKVSLSVTILLLVTTISITVTENAFAERYRNSQAAATSNSCLNPSFESSTLDIPNTIGNCGNTISQQEESSQASSPITLQSANPTLEVHPPPQLPAPEPPAPLASALLLVFKEAVCPEGVVCPGAQEFTLVVDGTNPNPSGPFNPFPVIAFQVFLDAGDYRVQEIGIPDTPDLTLTDIDFSVDCDSMQNGPIQAGETRTCAVTNTYEEASTS